MHSPNIISINKYISIYVYISPCPTNNPCILHSSHPTCKTSVAHLIPFNMSNHLLNIFKKTSLNKEGFSWLRKPSSNNLRETFQKIINNSRNSWVPLGRCLSPPWWPCQWRNPFCPTKSQFLALKRSWFWKEPRILICCIVFLGFVQLFQEGWNCYWEI